MHVKDASSQYKETQVKTANQGKLIVMLYDGAIKFLKVALDSLPNKKYDTVNNNIIKAQDIIAELMLSLNFEVGDFANKLYGLYSYMNKRLVEGNIKKTTEPIEEVIRYLVELKDAWEQIAHISTDNDRINIDLDQSGGVDICS